MARQTIENKVGAQERRMTMLDGDGGRVARVESQISQLRSEMHDEFFAIRSEMRDEFAAVRTEIRTGDEETRRFMRVLHEDLVSRIAAIQKG
jgi:hypothetical protein